MGVKIRSSEVRQEEDRVSHMIFADNCYLFAESKEQILKMIGDATEELKKRGLDWKEDQMELTKMWETHISWREEIRDQRGGSPEGHGSAHHKRS